MTTRQLHPSERAATVTVWAMPTDIIEKCWSIQKINSVTSNGNLSRGQPRYNFKHRTGFKTPPVSFLSLLGCLFFTVDVYLKHFSPSCGCSRAYIWGIGYVEITRSLTKYVLQSTVRWLTKCLNVDHTGTSRIQLPLAKWKKKETRKCKTGHEIKQCTQFLTSFSQWYTTDILGSNISNFRKSKHYNRFFFFF